MRMRGARGEKDGSVIALNEACFCLDVERERIDQWISDRSLIHGLDVELAKREHLFAASGVFVSSSDVASMTRQIEAIESVVKRPEYEKKALGRSGDASILMTQSSGPGLMMGYDFHITEEGPKLIEINTNAGGAFLANELTGATVGRYRDTILADTFFEEWRRSGRDRPLQTIAIVDVDPGRQYLYPDMLLARECLSRAGLTTLIAEPEHFEIINGRLVCHGQEIDLVYNRLTDFDLSAPAHRTLRDAFTEDIAVISPSPRHHALYADKRNLETLSDPHQLRALGVSSDHRATLAHLPSTQVIPAGGSDELWARRKGFFFKPANGYGGKAAYRGEKMTRKVWDRVCEGNYVAQELIPPTTRAIVQADKRATLKFDVRIYTHNAKPVLMAARIYEGQTTNFRTPGGGFGVVLDYETIREASAMSSNDCCLWAQAS